MKLDTSSVGKAVSQKFTGSRRLATAQAKALVMRSDIQKEMNEKLGGFVWHVDRWPNWLQVSVDVMGNDETDRNLQKQISETWLSQNQEEVSKMFRDVLGEDFGELAIMARPMGTESLYGNCCRTGCGGCINGAKDKLLDKVQDPNKPVDRLA